MDKDKPHPETMKQSERFAEAARQLECDDDEAKFNATLKKVAKAKPPAKDADDGK